MGHTHAPTYAHVHGMHDKLACKPNLILLLNFTFCKADVMNYVLDTTKTARHHTPKDAEARHLGPHDATDDGPRVQADAQEDGPPGHWVGDLAGLV